MSITSENITTAIVRRYVDGYRLAGSQESAADAIKFVAIILGIVVFVAVLSIVGSVGGFLGGLVFGAAFGGALFSIGIFIAAQGQVLKAVLDTAVNSSPFLTDEQRAVAMALRLGTDEPNADTGLSNDSKKVDRRCQFCDAMLYPQAERCHECGKVQP